MGATTAYESSVIESSYSSDSPLGKTIIDGGTSEESTSESSSLETETNTDSSSHESAKPAVETDVAMLTVAVPGDAKVTINGHPTSSDGTVRQFKSRGLKEGYAYTYVVNVTYNNIEGQAKSESKSVKLRSGDVARVEFEAPKPVEPVAPQPIPEDIVTVVRLHVPADAKVSLAGNATNGSGTIRTFRTKQLKPGQQWAGYTVRVTTLKSGQPATKQRTVDVVAGSTTELTFNFDEDSIASR
jgi:uncharacterized protein (TIGR03000 family)